ncbi:MAG TPA: universal stress protein [Gaiellaceae bacterium]|nr:universal stress protein [Gaiellaceae bacterium]
MAARPQRVLVGYDGSSGARRALETAADLVGYGSTLAVVSVGQDAADDPEAALEDAREQMRDRRLPATYVLRRGDAVGELVDAARVLGANLLVVGATTQNGDRRHGLGAVSVDVVRCAPCAVLVVR